MSPDNIIDLHADFASACARELQVAGYTPAGTPAEIIRSSTYPAGADFEIRLTRLVRSPGLLNAFRSLSARSTSAGFSMGDIPASICRLRTP